ncbi:MAG TPA: 16S rRNA (adenine(1518)-N(6)/adenine(1519)-N(6))-dimethyltransferase RsmA [Ignavibacteriaceae bacterium]|nr:16S rRNA (adenine(1518)-N(6)/adenine(1519)-N(6))-dimethyltransferase RsmA [Ignavibacteriaceae bacterium]
MQNKPLKRFGQNYLVDNNIINKIAEEINPQEDDIILEIGPGRGALTAKLLESKANISAVEIDSRVIDDLKSRFNNLSLYQSDILEYDFEEFSNLKKKKIKVAGNIPYNLTSPIVFKLIENIDYVSDAVLMVQYEVAKRMNAEKKTKDYGIFAVILQYFSEVKFCFKISPNVFYPKPNVDSALVHLYFNKGKAFGEFEKTFIKVVKASFGNRRKTLKNSLSNSIFKNIDFSLSGIDLGLRAEQLNTEDFKKLTNFVLDIRK